jgi:hypothetical protein
MLVVRIFAWSLQGGKEEDDGGRGLPERDEREHLGHGDSAREQRRMGAASLSDTGHPHGNRNTKPTTFETLTIGPRPPVGLRPDNGKCRWYTLFFISNFTITRTEEKNLSASRFSPSTVPVNHSIPRRPASSARRLSRSLPIPLDRHRSSTTIAISASRASCRAYMA